MRELGLLMIFMPISCTHTLTLLRYCSGDTLSLDIGTPYNRDNWIKSNLLHDNW